jgi:hypothetical protein
MESHAMAKKPLKDRIAEADELCSRQLADANEANERGDKTEAEQLYAKSGFWRDRYNKLAGNSGKARQMSDEHLKGNIDHRPLKASDKPRWDTHGGRYGGKLSDFQAQARNAERESMHSRAARVVEDWKAASGKPMLSAEQSHDLAARIVEAMVWAKGL